jgi:hypothetical protein
MYRMEEYIQQENYQERPKDLLIKCAENNKNMGSSTFVIATLSEHSPVLNGTLIGDSSKS